MEVSDKDIYEYIVNLAEDRVVINMLSVNKKFDDDLYFKKILERRYPLLIKFKPEDEAYKQFYLRMVKYMAKLWEEYKIPYILKFILKKFPPPYEWLQETLIRAEDNDNRPVVEFLLNAGIKV